MTSLVVDSDLRCPRCGKRLVFDAGQHEDRGDIEIRYVCWNDGYSEQGRNNHAAAKLTAAELLRRRLSAVDQGVPIPLRYDIPAVEEVEV